MIEINLLPEELKPKVKGKKTALSALGPSALIYLLPAGLGVLVFSHLCLAGLAIIKSSQYGILNNRWRSLEPQRKALEEFNREFLVFSEDAKALQRISLQKVNWAQKLNNLSAALPSGIWFTQLSVTAKELNLRGSAISLQKAEMNLINKFIDNLKSDTAFFKDFSALNLSSVQKKSLGGYDIAEFALVGQLKSK